MCGGAHHREVGARLRVEVEAQLVGVLGVGGEVRPDVEAEAAEVGRPHDVRDVADHQRTRRCAVHRADRRRLQPVGGCVRDALLEEAGPVGAVAEALQQNGTTLHRPENLLVDRQVVVDEVELGLAALREVDLVRVGDLDLAARNLEHQLFSRRHLSILTQGSTRVPIAAVAPAAGGA